MRRRGEGLRVCVFLTRGASLVDWERNGSLSREMALFERLGSLGFSISLVTHGGRDDLRIGRARPGIRVLCNRWGLPREQYEKWLPWLHGWHLRRSDVIRSNQIDGADVALWSARRWGKPVVARCGFLKSLFDERTFGEDSSQGEWARTLERRVFEGASAVQVTTESMRRTVVDRYGISASKVTVVPNYVDTDLFRPMPEVRPRPRTALFVGRLHEEKNPLALLDAIKRTSMELTMVGEGPLGPAIRSRIAAEGLRVRLPGNVPHNELPRLMNESEIFVQPSLIEGHPKTIVEAMACGCAIVASDIPPVRALGEDREMFRLCGTGSEQIAEGLAEVAADATWRQRMGRAARAAAMRDFSLDRVAGLEATVLRRAGSKAAGPADTMDCREV